MAYDEARYMQALKAADAAGDTAAAQQLAATIRANRAQATQAPAAPAQGGVIAETKASFEPKTQEQLAEFQARRAARQHEAQNSFLDNLVEGASEVIPDYWRGIKQAIAENKIASARRDIMGEEQPGNRQLGVPPSATIKAGEKVPGDTTKDTAQARLRENMDKLGLLRKEEEANRIAMGPVDRSVGGFIGNVGTNIALTAPVEAVQGVRALAGGLKLLAPAAARTGGLTGKNLLMANTLREGLTGAATGYMTPTVEGESRGNNTMLQAAFGTAIPAGGALLRTKPMQKLGDKILDTTPLLYKRRLQARNLRGQQAVDEANVPIAERNEAAKKLYDIEMRDAATADKVGAIDAAHAAEEATHNQQLAEQLRVDSMNAARGEGVNEAKMRLIRHAGWQTMPRSKLEAEEALKNVGKRYEDVVSPQEFDVSSIVPDIQRTVDMDMQGFKADDNRYLQSIATRLEGSASRSPNGAMAPGATYMKLRNEIGKKMRSPDVTGEFQDALANIRTQLDEAFDAGLDDATRGSVRTLRNQYAMGLRLNDLDWHPQTGFDLEAARKRLDKTRGAAVPRQELIDFLARSPDVATPTAIAPIEANPVIASRRPDVPVPEELQRFTPEAPDYARLGSQLSMIHGIPAAVFGPLGAGIVAAGAGGLAGATQAAKNPRISKLTARLLRNINASYGSNFATGEEKKPKE